MIRQALLQDMLETMDVAPINNIEYVALAALMLERAGYHAVLKRFSDRALQPEELKERALRIAAMAEDASAAGAMSVAPPNPVWMREMAAVQPSIRDARPPFWFRAVSDSQVSALDRSHHAIAAFRLLQEEAATHTLNTGAYARLSDSSTTRFVYTPGVGISEVDGPAQPRAEHVVEFNPVAEVLMPEQPAEEQRTAMEAFYAREIELATEALAERQRRELAAASAPTTGAQYADWQRYSSLGTTDDGDVF